MGNCLTGSEAIFGFCAWLTTKKEKTIMSSSDDTAPIVELIKTFCDENELPEPRNNYTDYLTMPLTEQKKSKSPPAKAYAITQIP